jgi:ribosomal protein L11 methyltransferase
MANIQRDVLETLVAGLLEALAPAGHLVLSGLLTADAAPVLVAYQQAGLRLIERADEGEWASLLLQR